MQPSPPSQAFKLWKTLSVSDERPHSSKRSKPISPLISDLFIPIVTIDATSPIAVIPPSSSTEARHWHHHPMGSQSPTPSLNKPPLLVTTGAAVTKLRSHHQSRR